MASRRCYRGLYVYTNDWNRCPCFVRDYKISNTHTLECATFCTGRHLKWFKLDCEMLSRETVSLVGPPKCTSPNWINYYFIHFRVCLPPPPLTPSLPLVPRSIYHAPSTHSRTNWAHRALASTHTKMAYASVTVYARCVLRVMRKYSNWCCRQGDAHSQPVNGLNRLALLSLSCNIHTHTPYHCELIRVSVRYSHTQHNNCHWFTRLKRNVRCCSFGIYLFIFADIRVLFVSMWRLPLCHLCARKVSLFMLSANCTPSPGNGGRIH